MKTKKYIKITRDQEKDTYQAYQDFNKWTKQLFYLKEYVDYEMQFYKNGVTNTGIGVFFPLFNLD